MVTGASRLPQIGSRLETGTGESSSVHVVAVTEMHVDLLNPYGAVAPFNPERDRPQLQAHVAEAVKAMIERDGKSTLDKVVARQAYASPAHEIVRVAAEVEADLIVVGTHGRRNIPRLLLGSVAELTVRLAGCPVLVVRPKKYDVAERVPQVEAPCPDCVARRAETDDRVLWCTRHMEHHPRPHAYHWEGPSMDSIRPWGFD